MRYLLGISCVSRPLFSKLITALTCAALLAAGLAKITVPAYGSDSLFACSCTKNANHPYCAACKAAHRDDCTCTNRPSEAPAAVPAPSATPLSGIQCGARTRVPNPIKAAVALEEIASEIKNIQAAQTAYQAKLEKTSAAIRDFEANKKSCKDTLSDLMGETEADQAAKNYERLQRLSACTLSGLRLDIEVLKRENITSSRIAGQLTEVNGIIKDIEPLNFQMIDARTRSTSMKAYIKSINSQCEQSTTTR